MKNFMHTRLINPRTPNVDALITATFMANDDILNKKRDWMQMPNRHYVQLHGPGKIEQ
jgi:hypothetical protein